MFALLLPFAFASAFLHLCGQQVRPSDQPRAWRENFLLAASAMGIVIVLVTELLGRFGLIHQLLLSVIWTFLLTLVLVHGLRSGRLSRGWSRLADTIKDAERMDVVLGGAVLMLLAVLVAVAFVSPQNNVDVMQYHMPRVLQWAQHGSLEHFPTAYDKQNSNPHFLELGVLNLRLLSGLDALSSLPQIVGLLGMMIAVSGAVSILGGARAPQWIAALFVFSLPMGLLQVTTAKNDVVVGFWTATLLYFVLLSKKRPLTAAEYLGLAGSLGLGILTKGTFVPFALLLVGWFFMPQVLLQSAGRTVAEGGLLLLVILALNGPLWARNLRTYDGFYGPGIPVRELAAQDVGPDPAPDFDLAQSQVNGVLERQLKAVARMIGMNMMTPVSFVNNLVLAGMERLPYFFPDGYRRELRGVVWNYAMHAPNPLHLLLIMLSLVYVARPILRGGWGLETQVGAVAVAGYGLISFAGCSHSIICMRYQLPFFVLGSVLLGATLDAFNRRWTAALGAILVLYSLPYVLINNMRPVIGLPPWPTRIQSVFAEPPPDILFAHIPAKQDEYEVIASRIEQNSCSQVGLYLKVRDFEYPIWWLQRAPREGVTVQHLNTTNWTAPLADPDFEPCAVVCTICGEMQSVQGVPLASDYGHVQYFELQVGP